nr:ribonuclease H-like domain-containing protein [Tanacetum cinerariifolium]
MEYEVEQYLTHTDYALWEVIINEDSLIPKPPAIAILDEHLLNFHSIKDVKSLWEAIKIRFGGNKESKKMHKTILKQQYKNFEDTNMKLLRTLPLAWNNIALIMRNKLDIETLSMDDFYNNLKVYEAEIKRQLSLSSNSHNVAFVSSENTSSINETINVAHDIPDAGSKEQPSAS